MDVPMADGGVDEPKSSQDDSRSLVQIVRSLDATGPGPNGENILRIWRLLTSSSQSQFYATEESVLRWLLKTMKGTNADAETVQRHPLTWKILACVFQRIPLFPLAKSLADRKFMAVLQQTLKRASKPESHKEPSTSGSKKRRRSFDLFDAEGLKTPDGCLQTGEAVFSALQTLLSRLESAAYQSPNDKMGAEHIRALFSLPAADAMEYLAPFLVICNHHLDTCGEDFTTFEESWIPLFSSLWDLHLQGSSDALEVATHLSRTACLMLSKVKDMPQASNLEFDGHNKSYKVGAFEKWMHRALILPARAAFLNRADLEIMVHAVEVTKHIAALSSPGLYSLAASAPRSLRGSNGLKENEAWMQQIFNLVQEPLRALDRAERVLIVRVILNQAISHNALIDLDSLRMVCRECALTAKSTNWPLLASVAECDVDTFLISEKGTTMFDEICPRLTGTTFKNDEDLESAHKFLECIIRGFVKARDLSTFLKKWYEELSKADPKQLAESKPRPIWYHSAIAGNPTLIEGVENSMTPKQLLALVEWIGSQENPQPEAIYIVIGFITTAIKSDEFIDALGIKLVDLLDTIRSTPKLPIDILSLRWRIISKTAPWADYSQRQSLWRRASGILPSALETQELASFDTYEAFKTACEYWISMYPDGEKLAEISSILTKFIDRLVDHLGTLSSDSWEVRWDPKTKQLGEEDSRILDHPVMTCFIVPYADYALGAATRLFSLMPTDGNTLPDPLRRILLMSVESNISPSMTTRLTSFLNAMLANENVLSNKTLTGGIVHYLIDVLEGADTTIPWTNPPVIVALEALANIPGECLTRQERERIMEILNRQRLAMGTKARRVPIATWNLVLGLMVKIMRRPTFYQNMAFADLSALADTVSSPTLSTENSNATYGVAHLLFDLASASIRQMVDHFEEWGVKYFNEAGLFLKECTEDTAVSDEKFLRMVLLQALISVITQSASFKGVAASFDLKDVQVRLSSLVRVCLNEYAEKWQAFGHGTESELPLHQLLVALDAGSFVEEEIRKDLKQCKVAELEEASNQAISEALLRGWKLRTFLIKYCPKQLTRPQPTNFKQLFVNDQDGPSEALELSDPVFSCNRSEVLNDCVDAVTKNLDDSGKLVYLERLIDELQQQSEGQLLAIYRVIGQMTDTSVELGQSTSFDLATAHSKLTRRLSDVGRAREFVRICELLHLLLDQKSGCMTQWNIETTLSTVAAIYSPYKALWSVNSSSKAFEWSCRLVEVIIKKHRRRLEGHYHLLIATMESLLRALARLPSSQSQGNTSSGAKQALRYNRLITLICEPAAAAVTRSQHINSLDSATDVAKKSAGRHMYLILMSYVKLQLEFDVSHDVREALEPGMNTIFDITPPEIRKILNDAMDASGRAILREMFKRYTKFGKWSGV